MIRNGAGAAPAQESNPLSGDSTGHARKLIGEPRAAARHARIRKGAEERDPLTGAPRLALPLQPASRALRRARALDEIAEALPQRASALSRLFLTRTSVHVSRTEAGVLAALAQGPRRITELALRERVTQPAITSLVNRLQARGWVARHHDPQDARAVLVALTRHGREAHRRLRAEYRALLHEEMATLRDADVRTLARAIEILDRLIERLGGSAP